MADTSWWEEMDEAAYAAWNPARRWAPFGDDAAEFVATRLPDTVGHGQPAFTAMAVARNAARVRPLPPAEPGVVLRACPQRPETLMAVIESRPDGQRLADLFPFTSGASNRPVWLHHALLLPGRAAAILSGELDDGRAISFYDAHWGAARSVYRRDDPPEFVLSCLAYRLRMLDGPEWIPVPDDILDLRRENPALLPPAWREGDRIDIAGVDEWSGGARPAPDDVWLRGTVESVRQLHHVILGQRLIEARLRACGELVAVVLTDHVRAGVLPQPGQRMEVEGWLSGTLWWLP